MGISNTKPFSVLKHAYQIKVNCTFPGCSKSYLSKSALSLHAKNKHQPQRASNGTEGNNESQEEEYDNGDGDAMDYSLDNEMESVIDEASESDVADVVEYSDEEDEVQESINNIMAARQNLLEFNDAEWEDITSEGTPFNNPQTMIMMCLFNSYTGNTLKKTVEDVLVWCGENSRACCRNHEGKEGFSYDFRKYDHKR